MALTQERADTKQLAPSAIEPADLALPCAAATKHFRGGIVLMDNAGNASKTTASTSVAVGRCKRTVDNSTGSAGDKMVEVERGVFLFKNSSGGDEVLSQHKFSICYVVDDETVAIGTGGNTRARAGIVFDVTSEGVWVKLGAIETLELTAVESDIADLQTALTTSQAMIPVPLSSFRVYADATALGVFDDGNKDGFDPTAESLGYRFNPESSAAIAASVPMPNDLDDGEDVVVHVLGYRVGSDDTTAALTVGAFFREAGSAFSADSDAGGDTSAFDGATTVVTEETLTIAAANVPASPSSLLLTLVPTADLDADDLVVLEVWLEYTKKLLAS